MKQAAQIADMSDILHGGTFARLESIKIDSHREK